MRRALAVLDIASVRALLESRSGIEGCFTAAELAQLRTRPGPRADPAPSIAARLAVKIAATEVLDAGPGPVARSPVGAAGAPVSVFRAPSPERAARLRGMEVLVSHAGVPSVVFDPAMYASTEAWRISMSHDGGLAAGFVVVGRP